MLMPFSKDLANKKFIAAINTTIMFLDLFCDDLSLVKLVLSFSISELTLTSSWVGSNINGILCKGP